jgi:ribosomal protein S27AE
VVNTIQDNEEVLVAGPRTQYIDAMLASLAQEGIVGREVRINDVPTSRRPVWACTPANEVYVVVLGDQLLAARDVVPWVSRVCLNCGSVLLAKAHDCQQCGTQHDREPGDGSFKMGCQDPGQK